MKCNFCGSEMKDGANYCPSCGVANKNSTEMKRKNKKANIIVAVIGTVLLILAIFGSIFIPRLIRHSPDYISSFNDYEEYEGSDKFRNGIVDYQNNTYVSDFGDLNFSLNDEWDVYTPADIRDMYDAADVSQDEYSNKLTVFDFYADNLSNGSSLSVSFYNAAFYDDYDSFEDFVEDDKDIMEDNETGTWQCDLAPDSNITFNGEKYRQIAGRFTSKDGGCYYQYNFMRELDGYYMEVTIYAYELSDVEEILNTLNSQSVLID